MSLTSLARVTGLLGGLAWVLRWPLGGAADDAAYWTGFVLLAVSLAAYGAGLVTAGWLKVVAGTALPILVWSVVEVLGGAADPELVDAGAGLVILLVSGLGLRRSRRDARAAAPPRPRSGTHAR